jgi:hypothetical protein
MGNFSRDTFDRQKGYVSVRLQQGVPLVDADWNELSDVTREEGYAGIDATTGDGIKSGSFGLASGGNNDLGVLAGAGIAAGRVFRSDVFSYDDQPWRDPAVAANDGVAPMPALTTPAADRTDVAYLDVWEREVGRSEDPAIVNSAIGIETSVRLRREVALRVAEGTATLPPAPSGHLHLPLALLHRIAGNAMMPGKNRQTDLRRVANAIAVPPLFQNAAPSGGWHITNVGGRYVAMNRSLNATGIVPVTLPQGARLRLLRVSGGVAFSNVGVFLWRLPHRVDVSLGSATPSPPDQIGSMTIPQTVPTMNLEPFEREVPLPGPTLPSDGREIVDNGRFSYVVEAAASPRQAEIHSVSLYYDF